MIRTGRAASKGPRLTGLAAAITLALSLSEGTASAQVSPWSVAVPPASPGLSVVAPPVDAAGQREKSVHQPIRDSLATIDFGPAARQRTPQGSLQPPVRGRSVTRKVLGAAIGATAGFFAGGYIGAAIEGDRCHCDDPGLQGAIIGAPIGAVTGGILGALFF